MTIMTLSIDDFRLPPELDIGSRGGLYMIRGGISMAEMGWPNGFGRAARASGWHLLRISVSTVLSWESSALLSLSIFQLLNPEAKQAQPAGAEADGPSIYR
jgi:hypothetical protein